MSEPDLARAAAGRSQDGQAGGEAEGGRHQRQGAAARHAVGCALAPACEEPANGPAMRCWHMGQACWQRAAAAEPGKPMARHSRQALDASPWEESLSWRDLQRSVGDGRAQAAPACRQSLLPGSPSSRMSHCRELRTLAMRTPTAAGMREYAVEMWGCWKMGKACQAPSGTRK